MFLTPQEISVLSARGFQQDSNEFKEVIGVDFSYRGWDIGLLIPDAGVASIFIGKGFCAFSHDENLTATYDKSAHVNHVKAAIDALLGPAPTQACLF